MQFGSAIDLQGRVAAGQNPRVVTARRGAGGWALAAGAAVLVLAGCSGTRQRVLFELGAAGSAPPPAPELDAGCARCPVAVALDGSAEGALHGGGSGTPHTDLCPGQQLLVGYAGSVQDVGLEPLPVIGSLRGLCASLALGDGGAVLARAGASLPLRGDAAAPGTLADFEQRCEDDQVVVGARGSAGLALDRLALVCAQVRWRDGDGDGGAAFTLGPETVLQASGGDGGAAFEDGCPPGTLARGQRVRSGRWIDAFGLVCATPSATPRAEN